MGLNSPVMRKCCLAFENLCEYQEQLSIDVYELIMFLRDRNSSCSKIIGFSFVIRAGHGTR